MISRALRFGVVVAIVLGACAPRVSVAPSASATATAGQPSPGVAEATPSPTPTHVAAHLGKSLVFAGNVALDCDDQSGYQGLSLQP